VKRTVAVMIVSGAVWMGLPRDAQAQALITPTGPLSIRTCPAEAAAALSGTILDRNKVYPGRTMGGGRRILRSNPPPSSLKRRRE
jgi:hypothetical protein